MKIDNKGFAFSTMLYGLLAVMIILLMLIFGLYKGSSEEAFYYSSVTDVKLNQCVNEEIALEECYRNSNSCSVVAYHACLGIEDDPGIITRKSKSEEKHNIDYIYSNISNMIYKCDVIPIGIVLNKNYKSSIDICDGIIFEGGDSFQKYDKEALLYCYKKIFLH